MSDEIMLFFPTEFLIEELERSIEYCAEYADRLEKVAEVSQTVAPHEVLSVREGVQHSRIIVSALKDCTDKEVAFPLNQHQMIIMGRDRIGEEELIEAEKEYGILKCTCRVSDGDKVAFHGDNCPMKEGK